MWLYYFLAVYIVLGAVCLYPVRKTNEAKFLYLIISFGLLAFLAMFRSEKVGNDTATYIELFYNITTSSNLAVLAVRYEMGYLLLNKILSYIANDHQILLITTSAYVYFVFGRFIFKHSNMAWLSVFLFFTLRYFDHSISEIRQMLAIATIVLSYEVIMDKKPLKFFLTVLLATFFHNAAMVFFAAYPLKKLRFSKKLITIITLATATGYMLFKVILNQLIVLFPRYSYYLEGTYLDGQARLGTAAELLVIIVILIISEICNQKVCNQNTGCEINRWAFSVKDDEDDLQSIFILIACAITVISFNGTIFSRFQNIYGIFSVVYLPNSLHKLKNKKTKFLAILLVVALFFAYSTYVQIYKPEWQSSYPYSFCWN